MRLLANTVCKIDSEASKVLDDGKDVNWSTCSSCGSGNGQCNYICCNALDSISAAISVVCAESAAIVLSSWAVLPANWTVTTIAIVARRVAEETTHFKSWCADQGFTSSTAIRVLGAGNTNISLSWRAVRGTDAASNIVEVRSASWVVESTPFLTSIFWVVSVAVVFVPEGISNTSTISLWLEAESAVVSEILGAVLPADWTDTVEAFSAERIAKSSILFLAFSTRCDDFTDTSSVGIFPAV